MEDQEITFLKQNVRNRVNQAFHPNLQSSYYNHLEKAGNNYVPDAKVAEVGRLWKAKLDSYFANLPEKMSSQQVDSVLSDMHDLSLHITIQTLQGGDPDDRQITEKWKEQITRALEKAYSILRHDLLPKTQQWIKSQFPKKTQPVQQSKPSLKRPPSLNPPLQTPPSLQQQGYHNPARFMRKLAEVNEPLMQSPDYGAEDSYSTKLNRKKKKPNA